MIYKLNNGGIIKLQKAGSVPEYGNIEQIAKYNREHGTHFWKMSQVLEHDKQQAQQKTQDKRKSVWEILAGHPESSGEAILNKTIETANNAELPETRSKIYNNTGKAQLTTTAGSLLALPMLGEFSTYGLLGGAARLAGGFGGSAVGSWGLGKAGDWTDKQFGTNWMGTTGRIIGGFAGWPTGSNFTYKGALDLASKVPSIAKIGTTKRFIGDVAGRTLNKELKNIVIPNYMPLNQEHNLFRANVYKGGDITDPYYASFTTDPNYAAQYGKVKPYLIESKSFGIAKEPLMGSSDPVTTDMFIDRNAGNKKLIIGRDAITNEFPYTSNGIEIVSLSPKNVHLVNQPQRTKISGTPFYRDVVPGSRPISEAERLGIPKSMRSNPKALEDPQYWGYQQWNDRYNAAVKAGDMAETQRLRDLHFKIKAPDTKVVDENGNPLHMYHGTGEYFTIFKDVNPSNIKLKTRGYHTKDYNLAKNVYARSWRKSSTGKSFIKTDANVYDNYLNITNPFIDTPNNNIQDLVHDLTGEWQSNWGSLYDKGRLLLRVEGHDGVYVPKYYNTYLPTNSAAQIKSADPITYNGFGEIIPIVKRDNFHNPDMRYKQGGILKAQGGTGLAGIPIIGNLAKKGFELVAKRSNGAQTKSIPTIIGDVITGRDKSFYNKNNSNGSNEIDTYLYGKPYTNKYVSKFIDFLHNNLRKGPAEQKAVGPLLWAYKKPTIVGKDGIKV